MKDMEVLKEAALAMMLAILIGVLIHYEYYGPAATLFCQFIFFELIRIHHDSR